jgi:MauM/NapG family ferredoxin protein
MLKKARIASQGAFLLIFLWLFLQTESKGANDLGYPVKIFLDADPLAAITTALATRSFNKMWLLAILVIVATVFLGRFFCGWLCPLGTLHNLCGSLVKVRVRKNQEPRGWYRMKYAILIFLLVSSVFTLQLSGVMDPISLLIRSLALSIYPAISYVITSLFDTVYKFNIPVVTPGSEYLYSLIKKGFLPFLQPVFQQAFLIGIIFISLLALNFAERRFWCKYLCPLGALLGLCSRYALLKRDLTEGCVDCGMCSAACQGGALRGNMSRWNKEECFACMDCDDICPQKAIRISVNRSWSAASPNLGRRRLIGAVASGLAAVPLLRITPLSRSGSADPSLIRPPGALAEKEFLSSCIKCGECMKVCITNGLQPTFLEAGIDGIWTPMLVPRIGYCEYRCTLCGQVCPTGAITKLSLQEKENIKIGLAEIDRNRCLPYAYGRPCIVCEEVCPTPKKAIWFEKVTVAGRDGKPLQVKQPRVDPELCVGCGICEAKCPVTSNPAIFVRRTGESRDKENQLLLSTSSEK